jgi:molybdopterin converting factor small subunit
VNSILNSVGVEHKVTSAYKPNTNGQTERTNFTIVDALRKHVGDKKDQWPEWLPYISMAYRSRIHSSTKFTPFELMFGRKMNLFSNVQSIALESIDTDLSLQKRTNEIKDLIENTLPKAKENIQGAQEAQIRNQNKAHKISETSLKAGTNVYVRTVGIKDKLHDKYVGPFTVVRQTGGGNYEVKNVLNELLIFPLERLKIVELEKSVKNSEYLGVDQILNDRSLTNGKFEYLVRWNKHGVHADSWEPSENFPDKTILDSYWQNKNKKLGIKTAKEKRELKKANKFLDQGKLNYLTILFIAIISIPLVFGYDLQIKDNFYLCKDLTPKDLGNQASLDFKN